MGASLAVSMFPTDFDTEDLVLPLWKKISRFVIFIRSRVSQGLRTGNILTMSFMNGGSIARSGHEFCLSDSVGVIEDESNVFSSRPVSSGQGFSGFINSVSARRVLAGAVLISTHDRLVAVRLTFAGVTESIDCLLVIADVSKEVPNLTLLVECVGVDFGGKLTSAALCLCLLLFSSSIFIFVLELGMGVLLSDSALGCSVVFADSRTW